MLERAAIEREIVVAGAGDRLEIWNRDAWRREFDEFEGSVDVAAERLARESHR
jgi:DNA-binding transcriptional regulator/RsmH inhibitor MraZ